jgi:prepilin-type N-terminal cleavage/methylation domain-containing protein
MRQKLSNMLGFTMIELLVVIAIIGILAVAVLSAINPIEQINKGRDTRTRSDAGELLGAVERYYSTSEIYPWNVGVTTAEVITGASWTAVTDVGDDVAFTGEAGQAGFGWLDVLANSQEVKGQYANRLWQDYNTQTAGDAEFVVLKEASSGSESQQVYVCFMPISQQFKTEAARRCCQQTDVAGVCANAGSNVGTAPTITGFDVCVGTANAGLIDVDNYLCLP